MTEIIGVRFKSNGKVYSFAPGPFSPVEGSFVVVETARGPECGEVATRRHAVPDDTLTVPLKPIVRLATAADMETLEKNRQYIAEAFRVCEERIAKRGLPMRLVDVECGFDSNKLIFYFTAEARVDFRELVKDLASAFHVRIELRQIGDRDEAKLLGGLGICGREFCCKGYLSTFQPITIKMAKEQGLALNPAKISGTCGRLMCCLRYESPVYEELIHLTPKVGSTVLLAGDPPVRAYVMETNLVTGKMRVKAENSELPLVVDRSEVERLQDPARRMTKEDLRDKREPARSSVGRPRPTASDSKPEAAPSVRPSAATNSSAPSRGVVTTERPAQKPVATPVQSPERQEPTPVLANDTRERVQTERRVALHPEFGEKTTGRQGTQDSSSMKGPKVVSYRQGSGQNRSSRGTTGTNPEAMTEHRASTRPTNGGGRRPDAERRANTRPRNNAAKPPKDEE